MAPRFPSLAEMFAAVFESKDLLVYAARDGEEMVAVSCVLVHGESAEFSGTATLPSHRGRGAQSALLAARAEAAVAAGVEWFIVETGKPAPGRSNTSLNNLFRAGFTPLYDRRNWIWKP
jgi:GNAT superfamily N-acetyltransferase